VNGKYVPDAHVLREPISARVLFEGTTLIHYEANGLHFTLLMTATEVFLAQSISAVLQNRSLIRAVARETAHKDGKRPGVTMVTYI
jgi:hypothetical protein